MEYEKHIKRLVLGYLKTTCKSSYRRFLKTHFHSQQKHIATRVAGQTLEDILKIYSRVQDIVQGRLEDTEYYKENGVEFSSPIYLVEQLTYLLDREGRFVSEPSVCGRSASVSSIAETYREQEDVPDHVTDVETTPEYTLPGNIQSSEDNSRCRTPFRRKSSGFKTPYLDRLPMVEQENISSVMSMKLLEKRDFHQKLAQNINTVLNTPPFPSTSQNESYTDKKGIGAELEETVKNTVTRIESDPIFDDLLQDFLCPVANSMGKVIPDDNSTQSRRSSYSRNLMESEEQDNRTSSSIFDQNNGPKLNNTDSTTNENVSNKDANKSAQADKELNNGVVMSKQLVGKTTASQQINNNVAVSGQAPQSFSTSLPNSQNFSSEICNYPSLISQTGTQQQFYIVNQPLVIPQTSQVMQLIQPIQTVPQPIIAVDHNVKIVPKNNANLTEQDIMTMPTIILNERNEITYADSGTGGTPLRLGEVQNIKEYLKVFGAAEKSPIVKKQSKKKVVTQALKPTPTIKVEIFKRNSPFRNTDDTIAESSETASNSKEALEEPIDVEQKSSSTATKSTLSENKVTSNDKIKAGTVGTPSPLITTARKPTPKSSSHIRNLTFPSPLRKTPSEKSDGNHNSPSALNKQQAAKDLFKNTSEEETQDIHQKAPPKEKSKHSADSNKTKSRKVKSPKKICSPKKQDSSIKPVKASKKNEKREKKIVEQEKSQSWDATLRKNVRASEQNHSTPVRRTTSRKWTRRSTELDDGDPDGKKLENVLKTPRKTKRTKGKTPSKKKTPKTDKPKPEKKIEEEAEIEPKKILSPSKLCNTASKRNMEVDGVNPPNNQQLVSNARKNITSLLETPLKEGALPSTETSLDPTNTPFTPMLRANLKGLTVGDTFSIDTPDVPVTPGLSLMENSSAAYCILHDTETNKATDAIVLSEERKSSVRKTDDEDFELSPRVYGCKEILDDFHKNRAGKKNLELIDNKGVVWDGSSDKEDKTDNSESNSDNESNNTVIQSASQLKAGSKVGNSRIPQKKNSNLCNTTPEINQLRENPDHSEDMEAKSQPSNHKNNSVSKKLKGNGNSSDSEIISKENFKDKNSKGICNENKNSSLSGDEKDKIPKDDIQEKVLENDGNKDVISTADSIKSVLSVSLENCVSHMTMSYSLKTEIDEKRKRIIELEKAGTSQAPKSSTRRRNSKSQRRSNLSGSKRKQSSPTKVVKRVDRNEQTENNGSYEKGDSQDEFFKKSGSNLHRTNKHCNKLENSSENICNQQDSQETIVNDSQNKNEPETEIGNMEDKPEEYVKPSDGQQINEANKSTDNLPDDADGSFWDTCDFEMQPEEISIIYDKMKTSKRRLSDPNLHLEKKGFDISLPLADGSMQKIRVVVTPFKTLWEIMPATSKKQEISVTSSVAAVTSTTLECSNDSENASSKAGDLDALRNSKKRKQRSDSCNSSSSSKRTKLSDFSKENIETLLTRLHGPSEKT